MVLTVQAKSIWRAADMHTVTLDTSHQDDDDWIFKVDGRLESIGDEYLSVDRYSLLSALREEAGRHILAAHDASQMAHVAYRLSKTEDECVERRIAWHEAERTLDVLIAIRRAKK